MRYGPHGLALCTLQHAAFDCHHIGVVPDLEIAVRRDALEEIDGPMLQHDLQSFQGRRIHLPRADHLKPRELKGCILAGTFDASRRASIESLP